MTATTLAIGQRAPASAVTGAALLFWLLAYGLLTIRSMFDPASSGDLFSTARFVATACGAGLLAGICILWDRSQTFSLLVRLRMLALAIGAAVAIMYGVRMLTAELFGQFGARESADALRWLIAWSGWFVAAVALWMARSGLMTASDVRRLLPKAAMLSAMTRWRPIMPPCASATSRRHGTGRRGYPPPRPSPAPPDRRVRASHAPH